MKLRRIKIENFRAIRNRKISFEDALRRIRPVTVLAGPNGCGKTSVLFAIVQALRGVMGYRTEDVPKPSDLDINQTGKPSDWSPEPVCAQVTLDLEFDKVEREAIPQIFEDTRDLRRETPQKLPELPNGRVQAIWKYPPSRDEDGTLKPSWFLSETQPWGAVSWFKGRQYAIGGWRHRKLRSRSLLDKVGGIHLFPQDRNLRSRVVGDWEEPPGPPNASAVPDVDDDQGRRVREQPVWGILQYLSSYVRGERWEAEQLPDEENWENRIKEAFRRICGPKEYVGFMYQRDDPIGAPCFRDGETVYPLQQAASGEQVIIEYLVRLTHPSPMNRSLILIDEPEIHLHPRWIRQLYRALPEIGVDNQFILTTHSLELRAMAAEDGTLVDMDEMDGKG